MTRASQTKWPVAAYPAVYFFAGTRWRSRLKLDDHYTAYDPGKKEMPAMSMPVAKRAVCRTGSLDDDTTAWIFCVHTDKGDIWLVPQSVLRNLQGRGFRAKTIAPPRLIGEADLDPATMKVASP